MTLLDGEVRPEHLSGGVLALFQARGVAKGAWVTGFSYRRNDLVVNSNVTYHCAVDHTSSAAFATDLAAGKWLVFQGVPGVTGPPGAAGPKGDRGIPGGAINVSDAMVPVTLAETLPDATNELGGVIPSVATKADLDALDKPFARVRLEGWHAKGDGGGGILDYDGGSSDTVDDGLVFAPAVTGRYTRPVDGILHSRWFGLRNHTTEDQSSKLQDFLHCIGKPQTNGQCYRGMLGPDIIDCAGATVYLERDGLGDGTGFYQNSAQLFGHRRNSILRNLNLVVGSPRWKIFTASGNVKISDFRVEGRLHVQNIEGNSVIENITVNRASLDTSGDPMVPDFPSTLYGTTSGAPADPATGVTWLEWADQYIFTIFASNHPLLTNLSLAGKAGSGIPSGDYLKGALVYSCANARFIQGTIFGCLDAVHIAAAGSTRVFLDGVKFEECEETQVWVESGEDHIISTWHRQGAGHGLTDPCIRIGSSTSTPANTRIEKARLFSDQAASGTAILVERANGVKIDDCWIEDFATGIEVTGSSATSGAGRSIADVEIGQRNAFSGNTADVTRGARTQPARPGAGAMRPWAIAQGATTTFSGYNGVNQTLHTSANRTITVGELAVGSEYKLAISKGNVSHTIAWDGDALTWVGSAPDLDSMTATQYAIITVNPVNTGAGAVRLARGEIFGS